MEWALPAGLVVGDFARFSVRTTHPGGLKEDRWDVRSLTVDVESAPTALRKRLLDLRGSPWHCFTNKLPDWTTRLCVPDAFGDTDPVGYLRLLITVGKDGLHTRGWAKVQLLGKPPVVVPDLNGGLKWVPGATYQCIVALPAGTTRGDLVALEVGADLGSGPFADSWDLAGVRVDVVEDPVARWLAMYRDALAVLGPQGAVGLGTDMNGFAFQIPFCAKPIVYPFKMPPELSADPAHPTELGRHRVGDREFDFHHDGLATYGQLPDFLFAASELAKQDPQAEVEFARLFESAEATLKMWEKARAAAEVMGGTPA
ncbi:MAG: hypothetical protein QM765_43405 [Myxococcales bacterium]